MELTNFNYNANWVLQSTTDYFGTSDGNGNVVSLVRYDGEVAAVYEYGPYGETLRRETPTSDTAVSDNPIRFASYYTDSETGFVYFGQRYYSPGIGRFINRDPIEEAGGVNLYGFCGNDPIGNVDYLGCSWLSKFWDRTFLSFFQHVALNWDHGRQYVADAASIILSIVVAIYAPELLSIESNFWAAVAGGAAGGFTGGFTGTILHGGSIGQAFESGLIGGAIGGALGGLGYEEFAPSPPQLASNGLTVTLRASVAALQRQAVGVSLWSGVAGAALGGGASYLTGLGQGAWGAVKATGNALIHPINAFQSTANGLGTFAGRAYYDSSALLGEIGNGAYSTVMNPESLGNAVGSLAGGLAIGYGVSGAYSAASGAFSAESTIAAESGAGAYSAIGSTGKIGEAALQELGGESQVYFQTSQGGRYIDQLVDGIANESKVGYQSLTQSNQLQILKDVELINSGQIQGSTWHFFKSPVTGLGGPSAPLQEFLNANGITTVIH